MSFDNTRPVVVWLHGSQQRWLVTEPGTIIGIRVFCGECGVVAESDEPMHIVVRPGRGAEFAIDGGHFPWKPGSRAVAYYLDDGVGGDPAVSREDEISKPREPVPA